MHISLLLLIVIIYYCMPALSPQIESTNSMIIINDLGFST